MNKSEMLKQIIAETIRELGSAPSGHVYAAIMGLVTLDEYQTIVNDLVRSGDITERGHLLTWKK
jgi:hypothetical protein